MGVSSGWIHGDLSAGNLLLVEGRLSAVIDFGGLGVGDPAEHEASNKPLVMTLRSQGKTDEENWSRLAENIRASPEYRQRIHSR